MHTILVLNSGECTGINFIRSLKLEPRWRVVGLDAILDEHHVSEADVRYYVPWTDPSELIERLNEIARNETVDLIYAADTGPELLAISSNRERLAAPTFLPSTADHTLTEDKWQTWLALNEAGLPVPDTVKVRSSEDLGHIFGRHSRVWLRRTSGSGGAGSVATSSQTFANAWVDEMNGWNCFTAAEYLSDRTATFSGVWLDGELVGSQLRERIGWKYGSRAVSGVTGVTGAQRTIWDPELHDIAVASVQATCRRPNGAIGVDFTYHGERGPLITEVQPARFYSSIYFLASAGFNLPHIYCSLAIDGRPIDLRPCINPIHEEYYWVKSVDTLPRLLTADEFRP
jgi:hypothetical protein